MAVHTPPRSRADVGPALVIPQRTCPFDEWLEHAGGQLKVKQI